MQKQKKQLFTALYSEYFLIRTPAITVSVYLIFTKILYLFFDLFFEYYVFYVA